MTNWIQPRIDLDRYRVAHVELLQHVGLHSGMLLGVVGVNLRIRVLDVTDAPINTLMESSYRLVESAR